MWRIRNKCLKNMLCTNLHIYDVAHHNRTKKTIKLLLKKRCPISSNRKTLKKLFLLKCNAIFLRATLYYCNTNFKTC